MGKTPKMPKQDLERASYLDFASNEAAIVADILEP